MTVEFYIEAKKLLDNVKSAHNKWRVEGFWGQTRDIIPGESDPFVDPFRGGDGFRNVAHFGEVPATWDAAKKEWAAGSPEKALAALAQTADELPASYHNSPLAFAKIGVAQYAVGDPEAALRSFGRAVEAFKTCGPSLMI